MNKIINKATQGIALYISERGGAKDKNKIKDSIDALKVIEKTLQQQIGEYEENNNLLQRTGYEFRWVE